MNTIDKPFVFFLDMKELRQSLKICVKNCPDKEITTKEQFGEYAMKTKNNLCRYDFNDTDLLDPSKSKSELFHFLGPCPSLPVFAQ